MDSKNAAWAENNRARSQEIKRSWQDRNPENLKSRKAAYRARHPVGYRRWNLENPEKVKEINKAYSANNRHKGAASAARRRARKLKATPAWADFELINDMYMEARYFGLEVDHIVPLDSPMVCGLHCESNLQLLTQTENRSKGNRLLPEAETL